MITITTPCPPVRAATLEQLKKDVPAEEKK